MEMLSDPTVQLVIALIVGLIIGVLFGRRGKGDLESQVGTLEGSLRTQKSKLADAEADAKKYQEQAASLTTANSTLEEQAQVVTHFLDIILLVQILLSGRTELTTLLNTMAPPLQTSMHLAHPLIQSL